MRWVLEVGFIALSTSWKWLLGVLVGVGALMGVLVGVGVIGGGSSDEPAPQVVAPTPVPTPRPTATRPAPTPAPTSVPEPTTPPTRTAPTPLPVVPDTATMQVLAAEADNIGSLEFVLVYDTDVWELADVEPGSLASNALVDTNFTSPGRLWTAIIDPNGITGDGPLAVLTFNRLGDANGPVAVTLQSVSAYNADTLVDVLTDATPGRLTPLDPIPPILTFR